MNTILKMKVEHPRQIDFIQHDEVSDVSADEPLIVHLVSGEDDEFVFQTATLCDSYLQRLYAPRVV